MNINEIERQFTYHTPSPDQAARIKEIREAAKAFAFLINANCPDSADKSTAIRRIREAAMFANVSIVLED